MQINLSNWYYFVLQDIQDTASLLSEDNINREEILKYALDAAEIATNHKMPTREFARDHLGRDDIAIFDFTAMFHCEFSTLIRERYGHNLVMTVVGDGLIEVRWRINLACFVLRAHISEIISNKKIHL